MAYVEVTVIEDGATGPCREFGYSEVQQSALDQFIADTRRQAESDGVPTQLFMLCHDHDETDTWCLCSQYATDHHADYEWNMDALAA